ncbi:MAG: zinc ribbon domain-containing protein [Armatimonadetes bacterium]|nr:zinc ribbon domain-containing protein [Armatimonadota bacterium]
MPLFEYGCRSCGARFELLAATRSVRPASPACPVCGSNRTGALLSACAIRRSGGGSAKASCGINTGRG